jgi:hypothetical protein
VRRALAIQLIINREWGLAKNENPYQGSFIVDDLTDLVEEAVLMEYDKITARGGVLGAMETGYQRSKIQDESMYYEMLKHTGEYPIVGVNTFRDPHADGADHARRGLMHRSGPGHDRREGIPAQPAEGLPFPQRGPGPEALAASAGGPLRRQHFCRTDGNGEMLQPGADHRCALWGGGAVPTQYVKTTQNGLLAQSLRWIRVSTPRHTPLCLRVESLIRLDLEPKSSF